MSVQTQTKNRNPRLVPLAGCLNFRDLGGYPVPGGFTRPGRLFRADDLCKLLPADVALVRELGVTCVVDLRQPYEVAAAPHPLAAVSWAEYHNIPMSDGMHHDAGVQVLPHSLYDLYAGLLASAGGRIAAVMRLLLRHRAGASVFHCAAGKDRTGVIAALLLELAGAADADIIADYSQSEDNLRPHFDRIREAAAGAGYDLPEFLLASPPCDMRRFLDTLRTRYGGAGRYLAGCGLSAHEIHVLNSILCAN